MPWAPVSMLSKPSLTMQGSKEDSLICRFPHGEIHSRQSHSKPSAAGYHKVTQSPSCQYALPLKQAEFFLGNAQLLQYTLWEAESDTESKGAQKSSMRRLSTAVPCRSKGLHTSENVQLHEQVAKQNHTYTTSIYNVYRLQRARDYIHWWGTGSTTTRKLIWLASARQQSFCHQMELEKTEYMNIIFSAKSHAAEGQQQQCERMTSPASNYNKGAFNTKSKTFERCIQKVQQTAAKTLPLV